MHRSAAAASDEATANIRENFSICSLIFLTFFVVNTAWEHFSTTLMAWHVSLQEHMTRELKRAYQELLLKYHPDKTGGKESDTFICVQVSIITNDIFTLKSSVFKINHNAGGLANPW